MYKRHRTFYQGNGAAEADWSPPPGTALETRRPMERPTMQSQVAVPAVQAIILALAGGALLTWLVVDAIGLMDSYWPTAGILALVIFVAAFMARMMSAESTLWSVEQWLGADLDRDGAVGEPEPHFVVVQSPPGRPEGPEARKRRELLEFVRAVAAAGDSSYRRWESALGRTRYTEFRDALLAAGLAEWVDGSNRRLGWRLTADLETIEKAVWPTG